MIALLFQVATLTTTFHVTAVEDHIRTKDEPAFSKPLHTLVVTGTIDGKRYRLDEAALMAYRFEVGEDYPVLKLKAGDKRIDIAVPNKKGNERKETLTIQSVEEITK